MKPKFINYFMKIADVTAELSYAKRLRVGAVLVKDNKILGTGYNGMPSGWENNCENEEYAEDGFHIIMTTKPEVLHAEMNCLMKVTQSTESSTGSTMFCTHAPCMDCAKAIYQAGIHTLYYKDLYRSDAGLTFLKLSNINVHQYTYSV